MSDTTASAPRSAGEQRTRYPFLVLKARKLWGLYHTAGKSEEKKAAPLLTNRAHSPVEPGTAENKQEREMQPCRISVTPIHRLPELLSPDNGARSSARSPHTAALEGKALRERDIERAVSGQAHAARLSPTAFSYSSQQRLYDSLVARNGHRGLKKTVLWKRAQFLEVMYRK